MKKERDMAHTVVKILTSDDGPKRIKPTWCYVVFWDSSPRTFCGGEAYGYGESGCKYKDKIVQKGGITCPKCLEMIKIIKSIKL